MGSEGVMGKWWSYLEGTIKIQSFTSSCSSLSGGISFVAVYACVHVIVCTVGS